MGEVRPIRLQRSRAKGSKLVSPNGLPVVCVTRPGVFGNPFSWRKLRELGFIGTERQLKRAAVDHFRMWLAGNVGWPGTPTQREAIRASLPDLRGKNLACWCRPGEPCHADVLLELANG